MKKGLHRKIFPRLGFTAIISLLSLAVSAQSNFFTDAGKNATLQTTEKRVTIPTEYRAAKLDMAAMKTFLWSLPSEQSIQYRRGQAPILALPMPDGSVARFYVWESSIQEPALEAKFPEIKTFAGQGIDDPYATIRFDLNPYFGFSAQILSPNGRVYIDPYARRDVNNYISYYHRDNKHNTGFECRTADQLSTENIVADAGPCRGTQLRTYRIAVACTGEYAQTVSGGTAAAGPTHAAIVTSINRVTQVYELELAVRLTLVANNNLVEFLNPGTDPFANDGDTDLDIITSNINSRVGSANYDIGHLFCTNESGGVGAGVAYVGVVCTSNKGGGLTGRANPTGDGYNIDYVAHEIGHQFGASHTFNTNTCFSAGGSYEPGGGTTIMAYAGICGATENIQPNSDPIFHARSFDQISTFVTSGNGSGCGTTSATGNTLPTITSMPNNGVSIPVGTPFVLNATATDADGDAITYNWEGWDVGAAGTWPSAASSTTRPLFRTRVSKTTGSRTFPDMRVIAANYPGTSAPSAMDGLRGETLPTVARAMKFRLTVRDNRAGGGGVVSSGDGCQGATIFQVNAVGTTPFAVTAPNTAVTWAGGSSQTVTWNNAGTTASPFNVANVRVTMSVDGGLTYPYELTASTPNDGSQVLTIPSLSSPSTTCRIRIEAIGNIFFDISNVNFTVSGAAACGTPGGLASSAISTSGATVSWTAVSGAVSYDVDYKTTASGTWTNAATGTASLSVNISGLAASTTYDWRVRTNCSGSSSSYAQAQFTTSTPATCNTPTGLGSSAVTHNSATVSWTAVSGAVSYSVDYKTNASGTWTNAASATISTSVPLSGLTGSTLYDWRVRTNCSSGSSSYTQAQFTTQAPPTGCATAYEANETLATAAAVSTNTAISAAIGSSTDIDYYKVVTTASSNFNITLGNLPGDYDLFLYNSAGTQIGASEASGTSNETITLNNQAAGTYYVRVIGYNGAFSTTVCYNLNIGATTVTGCASSYDNASNGTAAGASLIPFNTNITGLISPSGDVDYYRFVITTGGTATITLSTLPADYDLQLLSSNGTTQLAISENGSTNSETISRTYTAGTYYIRVYGYNGANSATSCYTLRVALGTASRENDLLTAGKVSAFPNPAKGIVNVSIGEVKGSADIRVFDIYGKMVLQQNTSRSNTPVDLSVLPSGVYMIRVMNGGKENTLKIVKD